MSKNPFINALCATLYISCIASLLFYLASFNIQEPSIIIPITVLSLFVLSAASMGFLFLYQPLLLLIDGQKKKAVALFLKTVLSFAGVTAALVSVWFLLTLMW